MPIPANPSLQDVVNEFGGPGDLRSYYRGGPYVTNAPANQNISTDANGLELAQFVGAVHAVPMSVSISPTSLTASPTATATCNVTGGIAPFKYQWSFTVTGGSGGTFPDIYNPNAQTTTVGSTGTRGNASGNLACTVTDAAGTVSSASIPANVVKTTNT